MTTLRTWLYTQTLTIGKDAFEIMDTTKGKIIFVLGGAKSGKSSFALKKAEQLSGKKAYIATAEPLDDEMKERIDKHKRERGKDWDAIEEPRKIADIIRTGSGKYSIFLVDCLTLWLSNLLCHDERAEEAIAEFLNSLRLTSHSSYFFIVSNEVGMGIVPDNALSRRFRDLAGHLNQQMASIADEVYLVTAGIPLRIK
jgi:adenosylcobinamide kinase / adenosylcobinamide-phosphate guanylyltransferase